MDIGSIFLIIAIAALVAMFIARPFVSTSAQSAGARRRSNEANPQRSILLAESERLMTALQELDFDYAMGKVPEEDYPTRRDSLRQAGANILRQLDNPAPAGKSQQASRPAPAAPLSPEDEELERMIAARRRSHTEKSAGFCPKCGNPVQKSDKFCSRCGKTL
jgi:hypothetical protein